MNACESWIEVVSKDFVGRGQEIQCDGVRTPVIIGAISVEATQTASAQIWHRAFSRQFYGRTLEGYCGLCQATLQSARLLA